MGIKSLFRKVQACSVDRSSFYGLLDLLSGTELNPGQNEIVQTAKQSCELLLKAF